MKNKYVDGAVSIAFGILVGGSSGILVGWALAYPLNKFLDKYVDAEYQKVWNAGVETVAELAVEAIEIAEEALKND